MANKIIGIYSGRFQPMGMHHADTFKWLQNKFGKDNTYIATSDKVDPPKSPLSFADKQLIASKYGFGNSIIKVKNPYKAEEITSKYDPKTTSVVFMVGAKDMAEDPRFKIGKKKDGSPSYFQKYEPGKDLKPYTEHGYLIVAPHTSYDVAGVGEMSGTNIRKALSNPKSTPDQFKQIFGWYDKNIESMLKKKFSANIAEIIIERAFLRTLLRELLKEGGAAGHMWHLFDVPSVKTGKDLISAFEKVADYITKNEVPVKIDGINSSIRLADYGGKRQFVIDRGSNKPLDVKGVTKSDLQNRFGQGHGMIGIGNKVLDIFNAGLKDKNVMSALDKLNIIDNPNILLNIEYVAGKSNVQQYDKNFLAIHNLLEIERVSPTKRQTTEIEYDQSALQELINALNPIANKAGFEIVGSIPAKAKSKPSLSKELSKNYTVNIDKNKKETKSLQQWLDQAKNTKGQKLKLKDGKTVDALSKQVYLAVSSGKNINDIVANPNDAKLAIDSWAIYQASVSLGDAILSATDTPLGKASEQEGIVIRDKSISPNPVKVTGSFIIKGMESSFQK